MSLPPLTPEPIRTKAAVYLKIQNFAYTEKAIRFCAEKDFSQSYFYSCLQHHFESGRKVYQKWKQDGSELLPECIMHLNLELSDTDIKEAYVQINIVKPGREKLDVGIHSHYRTPLPR